MDKNVKKYQQTLLANISKSVQGELEKGKALPVGTVRNWSGKLYKKANDGSWNFIKYVNESNKKKEESNETSLGKALKEAEASIQNQDYETLMAFDDEGNKVLEKDGKETEIDIGPSEEEKLNGKVVTHNHPKLDSDPDSYQPGSFSSGDVITACSSNSKQDRVITSNGEVFVMAAGDYENWGDMEGVAELGRMYIEAAEAEKNKTQKKINKLIEQGYDKKSQEVKDIKSDYANNSPHRAMKSIAEQTGLYYKYYSSEEKAKSYEAL